MIEKAKEKGPSRYRSQVVAKTYQRMVRAEAAAEPSGLTVAFMDGMVKEVFREVGQCVCVTCGLVGPWNGKAYGGGPIETGHYLAGRTASTVFAPTNSNPQCKTCNQHLSGNQGAYTAWMLHVYGQEESDSLQRLKNTVRQFTLEELVDLNIR